MLSKVINTCISIKSEKDVIPKEVLIIGEGKYGWRGMHGHVQWTCIPLKPLHKEFSGKVKVVERHGNKLIVVAE